MGVCPSDDLLGNPPDVTVMFGHMVPLRLGARDPAGAVARGCSVVRGLAFWLAVGLPLAYLPVVLIAPSVLTDPTLLVWTVTGNLVALVIGHGHEPTLALHDHR